MHRRVSYDKIADLPVHPGTRLNFDEFMDAAIAHFTAQPCTGPRCMHCAAQWIEGIRRIVEHPDDCAECAAIARRREQAEADASDPRVER